MTHEVETITVERLKTRIEQLETDIESTREFAQEATDVGGFIVISEMLECALRPEKFAVDCGFSPESEASND